MNNGILNAIANMGTQFQPVNSFMQGRQMALQNKLAQAQLAQATNGMSGNALSPEMQAHILETQNPDTRQNAMGWILSRNPKLGTELQGYYKNQNSSVTDTRTRDQKIMASLLPKVDSPESLDKALNIAGKMGVSGQTLQNVKSMWSPENKDLVLSAFGAGKAGPNKDVFNIEDKLRSQYLNQSKDFKSLGASYRKIVASAQNPSPAGDVSLIYGYMKMLDPGSTVMEGEQATARNAGGVDDRIRALYNSVIGGGNLSKSQRADFINRATDIYKSQATIQNQLDKQYAAFAQNAGVNPHNVLVNLGVPIEQPMIAPQSPTQWQSTMPQQQTQPAKPTSQSEYDALPSGALFVDPDDGKTYRKP